MHKINVCVALPFVQKLLTLPTEKCYEMNSRILNILCFVLIMLLLVACVSSKHYCNCG